MASETTATIVSIIKGVPRGRVASYGGIAAMAGLPNGARQVVRVLHSCSEKKALPWHRILRKDGTIALPRGAGFELQGKLLRREGVAVSRDGRVDMARFAWPGAERPAEASKGRRGERPPARLRGPRK